MATATHWWAQVTSPDGRAFRPVKVFVWRHDDDRRTTDLYHSAAGSPELLVSFAEPLTAGRGMRVADGDGDEWRVSSVSCGCGALGGLKAFRAEAPA